MMNEIFGEENYLQAEEITQDIFLDVYKKLRTLKDPNRFAGWLYVIASRRCFAWCKKKRIPMAERGDTLYILTTDELLAVDRGICYIGTRHRGVLRLHLNQPHSY